MQLALTPEVLVPVGAGAVLLLLALVAVLVVRRRRRRRARDRAPADAVGDVAGPAGATAPVEDVAVEDLPGDPAAGGPDGSAGGHPESGPAERVGSGRTVAAAVAQALAVREARARVAASSFPEGRAGEDEAPAPTDVSQAHVSQPHVPQPHVPQPHVPQPAVPARAGAPVQPGGPAPDAPGAPAGGAWQAPPPAPRGRGDVRDRLLAVLLDDPVRAVGAAVELDACRRQMDRLTDAVRHERDVLGSVLARLAAAGLAPDQLARLSGLSDEELRSLLPARVSA
ncbi:MAG: hypothetical protein L0I24_20075 [Pseudonocardia sp.]|nr:hypothetical protein [Pseudonocardia sp.]